MSLQTTDHVRHITNDPDHPRFGHTGRVMASRSTQGRVAALVRWPDVDLWHDAEDLLPLPATEEQERRAAAQQIAELLRVVDPLHAMLLASYADGNIDDNDVHRLWNFGGSSAAAITETFAPLRQRIEAAGEQLSRALLQAFEIATNPPRITTGPPLDPETVAMFTVDPGRLIIPEDSIDPLDGFTLGYDRGYIGIGLHCDQCPDTDDDSEPGANYVPILEIPDGAPLAHVIDWAHQHTRNGHTKP